MSFHDITLPEYISIFAVGSSEFSTSCAVSMSGGELRNSDNSMPKRRYFLKDTKLSNNQFESFNSFFKARAGRRFSFRMKDHFDYQAKKQVIAIGDGAKQEFQLQKLYEDSISPFIREITKPYTETVALWKNEDGIEAESIDKNTGIIKLSEILTEGDKLYASFEFDVPVRFANDNFQYSFNDDGTIMLENVELIEVYE